MHWNSCIFNMKSTNQLDEFYIWMRWPTLIQHDFEGKDVRSLLEMSFSCCKRHWICCFIIFCSFFDQDWFTCATNKYKNSKNKSRWRNYQRGANGVVHFQVSIFLFCFFVFYLCGIELICIKVVLVLVCFTMAKCSTVCTLRPDEEMKVI